ncbi:unnamed protein product [Callosobruchus maculatus]|nr:unnamed protein product [Callosobruchus maculatus]
MMFESYIPKWMNFWVMFAWQHLPAYGFPVIELAMDFTVFSIVSLTAMQFRLLRHEMEVIFKDSKDGIFVMDKFRKCSEHLTFLLGFRDSVNSTFSWVVFLYLGIITLIICIEIYFISILENTEDMLRAVVYAALMFFEFFICYCFPAQSLVDESQKIATTFFDSGWYNHLKYHRNTILLLGKAQLQVNFTVGGFLNLDLQTGLTMARSMFSYSMFLRTMTILKEEL